MTRLTITQVPGTPVRRPLGRHGADGNEHTGSKGAGGRRRCGRYLAIGALTLGLMAMSAPGALAFNRQPEPPGRPHSSVRPAFDPEPIPPGRPHPSVHPAFNPQPDPPGRPRSSVDLRLERLPAGLQAALARLGLSAARGARWTPGERSLGRFAIRLSCRCGGGGGHIPLPPPPTEVELTAPGGVQNAMFGESVALSSDGNTALIGAPSANFYGNGSGAAYVFVRSSGGIWFEQTELSASDAAYDDYFGQSVALSSDGNTALVGASGQNGTAGAAYIFARTNGAWTQKKELTALDSAPGDGFGASVALSSNGGTALIGAYGKNNHTGAAYAFVGSGSTWIQVPELTASDGVSGDLFGAHVALSGDGNTALIGAYYKNNGTGAAYIFALSGATWIQQAELIASDHGPLSYFGTSGSLSSNGGVALVGASGGTGPTGSGTAYVFVSYFGWYQAAELIPSDGFNGESFGADVALNSAGTTALIGAPGMYTTGAAYSFQGSWSSWTQTRKMTDGVTGAHFGASVALSDAGVNLLGAYETNLATGAAYVF